MSAPLLPELQPAHVRETALVTDAKTLTGMCWLQNVQRGDWALHWRSSAELDVAGKVAAPAR